MASQKIECLYYIKNQPAVLVQRVELKPKPVKIFEPFDVALIIMENDIPLYTEGGIDPFGLETIGDLKMLIWGQKEFVIPDSELDKFYVNKRKEK